MVGPGMSKSSFPPEKADSRILRGYCGALRFGYHGPLHIGPKAHAEESIKSKDEWERPKSSRDYAEDGHVLGRPTLKKGS